MAKDLIIRSSAEEFITFKVQEKDKGIQVRYENETLWMTQKAMGELFNVEQPAIAKHLINIYNEKELDKDSIRSKKISDMKNRVYIGNNSDADIYVSIHMNYYTDSQYNGWQTFCQSKSENSKRLATIIQQSLNDNIGQNKRNPMAIKGAYIMDKVKIPSVIVECGFLSNKSDEEKLKTDSYQTQLAWGVYVGVQKYFMEE